MKKSIVSLLVFSLCISPCLILAEATQNPDSSEIASLNSLPGAKALLSKSGAGSTCKTTCTKQPYYPYSTECTETCTDDSDSGYTGGGGGGGEVSPLAYVALAAGVVIIIWVLSGGLESK